MNKEQLKNIESQFVSTPLDEHISRIHKMNEEYETPSAHGLGIELALVMARELLKNKPLGSESGLLIAGWSDLYPASIVEECVIVARQFLLEPQNLRDALALRLVQEGED